MFPECWLGAEGERRVGTCMPYMYTCRIATGEFVVHVYVLVVHVNGNLTCNTHQFCLVPVMW